MENILIVGIIIALAGAGVYSAVRHFRGQGGCCGSGGYRVRKKKLKNTLYTKVFRVEGMHCENCKRRVEEAVNDIPDAAGSVSLKKGEVTVSCAREIDDSVIIAKITRAGYTVSR